MAALRAGRRGVGYDLESEYIDLARGRLATEKDRIKAGSLAEWRRSDLAGRAAPQDGLFPALNGHDDTEHLLERAAESG